jgi:rod shape-determining protein MreC
MVVDHRGGIWRRRGPGCRCSTSRVLIASLPGALAVAMRDAVVTRDRSSPASATRCWPNCWWRAPSWPGSTPAARERPLRDLLGGTRGLELSVQLAGIADIDLDPFRHRVLLDRGARDGVPRAWR